VTTTDVTNRRNTPAGKVPPCSTVLLYGFKRDLNTYLANRSFGPGVSVSGNGIQQRTINTLADVIDFDKDTTHPSNPEVHMKYGQDIAIGADFLDISPGSVDTQDYLADRALDLKLTRTCGLDILYTGVVPASCSDVITTPLPSCIGTKYDAVLFPANFGANAPARAGYPSVIVPAGFFPNGAAATLPNPQPSPFGATFSGPAFSEPKLIGFAYALEQATKDVAGHHRVPSSKVP
jgi:amidase